MDNNNGKKQPAKRVEIVKIKQVRESSVLYQKRHIKSPADAVELLQPFFEELDREQFIVLCLDTRNMPSSLNMTALGSLNSSIVHPREVFKSAILSNSASIIIAHNHPSGDPTPSEQDIEITKRLKQSGEILGITVFDHLIIGNSFVSMKERGML